MRASTRSAMRPAGSRGQAAFEHRIVVRNTLFGSARTPDALRAIPRVISTDPELAEIGLNEAAGRRGSVAASA